MSWPHVLLWLVLGVAVALIGDRKNSRWECLACMALGEIAMWAAR